MKYLVARNYEEYLAICKSFLLEAVGEDGSDTYVPFDSYEEWAEYFGAELPENEEGDEYLPIEDFAGELKMRPKENEYPVIVVHNFFKVEDIRNDKMPVQIFDWKSAGELTLKVDENVLGVTKALSDFNPVTGEQTPIDRFISFETENPMLSSRYEDLEKRLHAKVDEPIIPVEGLDAELLLNRLASTFLQNGDVQLERDMRVRHLVSIIPNVCAVVTVSHKVLGLGKESKSVSFDGIVVNEKTTSENIDHFWKVFAITGLT
ncbi:hypothetical protein JMA_39260 (plasmid) [Jeotgalibacillus malaysiensis]|uniref:Uncharacterized protein n=1 Tax=Jeotgalibacillus malaysiensis TaxID=1508404 RepID=A0A0B5AZ54_9BACL|nr:hypothetical protein [Jeotgalibacillus malaysiensis]AJD93244.1 hypothetical protein JMA_39260 [Jeotgalibacillus malaysiensis]